jgi:hypothetical protein
MMTTGACSRRSSLSKSCLHPYNPSSWTTQRVGESVRPVSLYIHGPAARAARPLEVPSPIVDASPVQGGRAISAFVYLSHATNRTSGAIWWRGRWRCRVPWDAVVNLTSVMCVGTTFPDHIRPVFFVFFFGLTPLSTLILPATFDCPVLMTPLSARYRAF